MHSYLIVHHTHSSFEVALFINNQLHDHYVEDKRLASKLLINLIAQLLKKNNRSFATLSFIGINQGPGLFSTVRSIIATVNGLHYAQGLPIIGIDALEATASEFYDATFCYNAILLNACNNEVYYLLTKNAQHIMHGYKNITELLGNLAQQFPHQTIRFIGNGTALYLDALRAHSNINAFIPETIPQLCSIDMIGKLALQKYNDKNYDTYLFPLHLKKHAVER